MTLFINAYDFAKAKSIIDENADDIVMATLYMAPDYEWTAETVWKDGAYTMDLLDPNATVAGLRYSLWASPALNLLYRDGRARKFYDVGRRLQGEEAEREIALYEAIVSKWDEEDEEEEEKKRDCPAQDETPETEQGGQRNVTPGRVILIRPRTAPVREGR